MKKILALFALGLSAMAAQAQLSVLQPQEAPARANVRTAAAVVPTAGEATSMDFGLCGDPYTGMKLGAYTCGGAAFQFTTDNAKRFAGCKITHILVAGGYPQSPIDVTAFVSKTLSPSAAMAQATGTMTAADSRNWIELKLDTPVEITSGQSLYIGYTLTGVTSSDYPICVDYMPVNAPSCFVGLGDAVNALSWSNYASKYGSACIRARIEGDNLPTDEAYLLDMWIPYTKTTNVDGEVQVAVRNNASNTLTNVDLEVTVGDDEPFVKNVKLKDPIGFNQYSVAALDFTYALQGNNIPVTCKVVKVNGVDNKYDGTGSLSMSQLFLNIDPDKGYEKNVVVEEGTGTWCGWCVRGIVGLEKMSEEHPDGTFIPIGIHVNDEMVCSGYSGVTNWMSGYPSCVINRNLMEYGVADPNYSTFQEIYEVERQIPAVGKIRITKVSDTSATMHKVTTECEFAFDDDAAQYAIALVATENGVGPYDQQNYYSGGSSAMGGWEKKGSPVSWTFSDVARGISNVWGGTNSVPKSVAAGETYTWAGNVTAKFTGSNVRYIALLLNKTTKRVENAFMYNPAESISTVEADSAAGPAVYFDLNGRRVADPSKPGLYITNEGEKILVK